MRSTFTERFMQEQRLSQQVSKEWGYNVSPSQMQSSKVSRVSEKIVNINRNIKPLQMNSKKPKISSQHEQLIKQIAEIEHQKKMRKKAEEKNQVEFNVSKLMNDRVRQYNYLIDHKHIKQKNSEDTKRVLKLKPKSQAQKIIQEIKIKNEQLINTQDINKQFKLNKSIALLYRKYKQKMYEDHNDNEEKKMHQTLVASSHNKNLKIRNKSIGSQGRNRNYSECLTNLKIKIDSEDNCEQTTNDNEEIDTKYPYMNDEDIKKNNEFQRKVENNKDFLEMYKFKITTLKNFNKDQDIRKSKKPLSGKKKFKKQDDKQQASRVQNSLFPGRQKTGHTAEINEHLIAELREKRKNQIKYFSAFLQKRNRKFKKPWGNKILIKYDSGSQAKNMLEGTSATISPNKTQYFTPTGSHLGHQIGNKSASFYSIPKNIPEEDKMIFESMREQSEDPKLYETMCKNQKVNLFLKAAKRNKF